MSVTAVSLIWILLLALLGKGESFYAWDCWTAGLLDCEGSMKHSTVPSEPSSVLRAHPLIRRLGGVVGICFVATTYLLVGRVFQNRATSVAGAEDGRHGD